MMDTFVLLTAAAILPLLLLLFAFVGCEAHESGKNPEAYLTIGPGSFGNIERVDIKVRFNGEEHPHQNSFVSPIDQTDDWRLICPNIDAEDNGEVKSVEVICECELVPKIPVLESLISTATGDSIQLRRFELFGEEFGFKLEVHADL